MNLAYIFDLDNYKGRLCALIKLLYFREIKQRFANFVLFQHFLVSLNDKALMAFKSNLLNPQTGIKPLLFL